MNDLRIGIPFALLESVNSSPVAQQLRPLAERLDDAHFDSRPNGNTAEEKSSRSSRPSSSATAGVQSTKALQAQQYLSFGGFDEFASAPAASIPKQPASSRGDDISHSSFIAFSQSAATAGASRTHEGEEHITDRILKSSEPLKHV
jgi:hypothetical protein